MSSHSPTSTNSNNKCDICGKSFTLKHNLQKHKKVVHEKKVYQCENCDKSFTLKHSLYETVKFTATYLKCVSALDFSLRAAWAGHWLLGRPKQL